MRNRIVTLLALVLVVLLVGANLSTGAEKNRLARKVQKLTKRVVALETATSGVESCQSQSCQAQIIDLQHRAQWLNTEGHYLGRVLGTVRPLHGECEADAPAVWRLNGNDEVYLSCDPPPEP